VTECLQNSFELFLGCVSSPSVNPVLDNLEGEEKHFLEYNSSEELLINNK